MTRKTLGTTGIAIPRAVLGCGTFGGIGGARHLVGRGLDRKAAFATLDEALALGIDVLDTAERYADGESECAIGDWLRHRPPELTRRVRIATKVAPPTADGVDGTRFDRAYIERKLETSLDRLGLERVTFYLSHAPDEMLYPYPLNVCIRTSGPALEGAAYDGRNAILRMGREAELRPSAVRVTASYGREQAGYSWQRPWQQACWNLNFDMKVTTFMRYTGFDFVLELGTLATKETSVVLPPVAIQFTPNYWTLCYFTRCREYGH